MAVDWQLERLSPAARRGERISLDRDRGSYWVGRSQRCDIRLYTASASRRHAQLRCPPDGGWVLVPMPDKLVLADGERVQGECELCEGLNLVLGRDRRSGIEGTASSPRRGLSR